MANSVSEILDEVFNKHRDIASVRTEKENARHKFLVRFDEVAQSVILKTAEEFAAELKKRGHGLKTKIASSANPSLESISSSGGVFIQFLPKMRDFGSGCSPVMSFVPCDHSDQVQIRAMCLEPGMSGHEINLNSHALEKITAEFMRERLAQLTAGGLSVADHATIK